MAKNELPDWVSLILIVIILAAIFPIAMQRIFEGILLGLIIGIGAGVAVIIAWFYWQHH